MATKKEVKKLLINGIIVGLILGIVALLLDQFTFIKRSELKTLDLRFKLRPTLQVSPDIGYIDYDDPSIDLFGLWPWPRNRQVALVDTLKFYNATSAGYDVFFSENSNIVFYPELLTGILESPAEHYRKFILETQKSSNIPQQSYSFIDKKVYKNLMLHTLENSFKNYDAEFEQSLQNAKNIYLAMFMSFPSEDIAKLPFEELLAKTREKRKDFPEDKNLSIAEIEKNALPDTSEHFKDIYKKNIFKTFDVVAPLYRFTKAAAGVGFAQIVEDLDYTVRLFPILLHYDRSIFPAITLKMALDLMDINLTDIELIPDKYVRFKNALVYGSKNNERRDFTIPVDKNGQLLMNWAGEFNNTYFHFSFKTIAYYYAFIKAKEIAMQSPAEIEYLDIAYSNIRNFLIREELTETAQTDEISAKIALARCIEPEIKKDIEHSKIKEKIKIPAIAAYFDETYQSVKIALDAINKLENNNQLTLDEFIATDNYQTDLDTIDEIFTNINWFKKQNRLNDGAPFYFPPKQEILKDGKKIKVSPTYIEKKIFMIGLTGLGTIDLNPMPFEQNCPMVALHTNALNLFLTRQPLKFTPDWFKYGAPILLALFIGIISSFLSAARGIIAAIIASLIYCAFIWFSWLKFGIWLTVVTPLVAIYLSYLAVAIFKFLQSSAERKKIRNIFSTMVSPAVLKVMEDNPDLLSLKGERKAATTSFSMVNGFAKVSNSVAPEYLNKILSIYLTPTSEIIMDYDGYIDKYEGHIIMADFGVPLDDMDNPWKCAYAAVEHQLDVKPFQYYIHANYGVNVYATLGLNFGYVSAGNMGSDKKMQYTVMGDAVNVAARFMPANIIYNTSIITGGSTYYKIKDFTELRKLDRLLLKGKTTPTQIYEVLGWNKEAYLKLLKNKPVPESVLTRWKTAPAGKVFGYHKYWLATSKEFSHPLISKIKDFFESQLIINANIFEYHTKISFLQLNDETKKTAEKYEISTEKIINKNYTELLDDWINIIIEPILGRLKSNTDKIEEFHSVQLLANKIEMFKNKLAIIENIDELLILANEKTKEFILLQNLENTAAEKIKLISEADKLHKDYQLAAENFYNKIKEQPQEYRNMMAEIGSITATKAKVRDIYESSMEKYYNREWDAAISGFEECLKLLPDDQPAVTLLERTKIMKDNPPASNWQGEFIQTKK